MTESISLCNQCGKTSLENYGLCVDCYYKLQVAKTLEVRLLAIGMNHAADQMDSVTGMIGFTPKMQVPEIPKGPPILNNITLNNSTLGVLNTGTVQTIDVSISALNQSGNQEISVALKQLTDIIAASIELNTNAKNEALDQLAYLSQQAVGALKDRKPGMIKAAISYLGTTATTVTALANAWPHIHPILNQYFGIS